MAWYKIHLLYGHNFKGELTPPSKKISFIQLRFENVYVLKIYFIGECWVLLLVKGC